MGLHILLLLLLLLQWVRILVLRLLGANQVDVQSKIVVDVSASGNILRRVKKVVAQICTGL